MLPVKIHGLVRESLLLSIAGSYTQLQSTLRARLTDDGKMEGTYT